MRILIDLPSDVLKIAEQQAKAVNNSRKAYLEYIIMQHVNTGQSNKPKHNKLNQSPTVKNG